MTVKYWRNPTVYFSNAISPRQLNIPSQNCNRTRVAVLHSIRTVIESLRPLIAAVWGPIVWPIDRLTEPVNVPCLYNNLLSCKLALLNGFI